MAAVAGYDSGSRVPAPVAPQMVPSIHNLGGGEAISGSVSRPDVSAQTANWGCVLVAGAPARREVLGQAVVQGGWQVNRASRIDIAVRMATQRRMRLAIVELDGNDD